MESAAMAKSANDIASLSFEKALEELETIVSKLEKGQVELDESITLYERGAALKAHCDAKLKSAQERIEKIVVGEDGAPRAEPAKFD
jgi:exodeoxyribonuclease VII small subunit